MAIPKETPRLTNRIIFAFAFWFYSCYYVLSIELGRGPPTMGVVMLGLFIALPSAGLVFIPLSKNISNNFLNKGLRTVVGVMVVMTLILFIFSNYILDFSDLTLYFVSLLFAALTAIYLTVSLKKPTIGDIIEIWFWSLGIFFLQTIYALAVLILSMGPII